MNPAALGIALESPQRHDFYRGSEDLQRKARPAGERPEKNKNPNSRLSNLKTLETPF